MNAILTNTLTGVKTYCHISSEHPCGLVWMDDANNTPMLPFGDDNPLYTVEIVMNPDVRQRIGKDIARIMKEKKWTLEKLSEMTGHNKSNLCQIVNGKYAVGLDVLDNIAKALGKSIELI